MKSVNFWDITPCSPLSTDASEETSVDTQRTARRYIPEADTLHNHRCENLKSYINMMLNIRKWMILCSSTKTFSYENEYIYNNRNYWVFGLGPSYGILKKTPKKITFRNVKGGRNLLCWVRSKELTWLWIALSNGSSFRNAVFFSVF
jgi:hypothetical protein